MEPHVILAAPHGRRQARGGQSELAFAIPVIVLNSSWRLRKVLEIPITAWIVLGCFVAYLAFFLVPNFFSTDHVQFFAYSRTVHNLEIGDTTGMDLKETLAWSANWLDWGKPVAPQGGDFPPLASLLLVPLLGVAFPAAYIIVTVLSVLSYVLLTLIIPTWIAGVRKAASLPLMLCATGLLSYGLQFELERGQMNVIAVTLALLAVLVYHRYERLRLLAYLLISLSVQLKLYPLVFVVALVRDWRDWKRDLRRLTLLVGVNLVLLMIRGPAAFAVAIQTLQTWGQGPYIWVGNPSIASGASIAVAYASRHGLPWLQQHAGPIETLLYLLVVASLVLIVLRSYLQKRSGIDPYLLLVLVDGVLLMASGGHDYRLSLLGGPIALVFISEIVQDRTDANPAMRLLARLLLFVLALAYSSTLFSFAQKPLLLANNLPALLVMLAIVTVLGLLSRQTLEPTTT